MTFTVHYLKSHVLLCDVKRSLRAFPGPRAGYETSVTKYFVARRRWAMVASVSALGTDGDERSHNISQTLAARGEVVTVSMKTYLCLLSKWLNVSGASKTVELSSRAAPVLAFGFSLS